MISGFKHSKLSDVDREWINNFPKIINENKCWIPPHTPTNGRNSEYVSVKIEGNSYNLHRLSMCVFNNINYNNFNIECRHSTGCDKRCFNPEHLKPGTASENCMDAVRDKTHRNAAKERCPKCDGEYKTQTTKTGINRGYKSRYCPRCRNRRNWARYEK